MIRSASKPFGKITRLCRAGLRADCTAYRPPPRAFSGHPNRCAFYRFQPVTPIGARAQKTGSVPECVRKHQREVASCSSCPIGQHLDRRARRIAFVIRKGRINIGQFMRVGFRSPEPRGRIATDSSTCNKAAPRPRASLHAPFRHKKEMPPPRYQLGDAASRSRCAGVHFSQSFVMARGIKHLQFEPGPCFFGPRASAVP